MEDGVGQAHGRQHVGGVEGAGGAGGARGGADAVLVEHEQDGFPFDVFEADVDGVG